MAKPAVVHAVRVGLGLLVLGLFIVWVLSLFNVTPLIQGQVGPGIDVFAMLYIEAQFIERIIEPFSESSPLKKGVFGDTEQIRQSKQEVQDSNALVATIEKELQSLIAGRLDAVAQGVSANAAEIQINELQGRQQQAKEKVNQLNDTIDKQSSTRVYSFWGLTSLMGMMLVYITAGLFQTIGITFQNISVAGQIILHGHAIDSIISGVVVGAGTKPLHDLIGTLEKSKQ